MRVTFVLGHLLQGCGDIALGLWIIEDGQLVLEDEISSFVFNGSFPIVVSF
jgi:hypothetical protein